MADNYDKLTPGEQCFWNVYTRLRQLSDWDGFTDYQDQTKTDSRAWLVAKRKEIWRLAQPKSEGGDGKGWGASNRQARYDMLKDDSLNTGSPHDLCQLPTNGGTPSEKANISEREMWWNQASVDDTTKQWRQHNADVLTGRRKQVWHLGEDDGWDQAERQLRYDNLCVATKTGVAYEQWSNTHNDHTGAENAAPSGGSSRAKAVSQAKGYVGVHENPDGSNKGREQPSGWQDRVYGSDGVPWCACAATCWAWDVGVKGSSSAAVQYCMSMAQSGQGMYRGWTTDPGSVLHGDLVVIGCSTCHIGMVAETPGAGASSVKTVEGNTSGSNQYNGGQVQAKTRSMSEIVGFCLVDYP